jgi:chloride channel 7
VILLEATGNEQFVLPLMITLFCARIIGSLFNSDLYHIHIHLKPGVRFLDSEMKAVTGHHDLFAGHIMGKDVVFVRPTEKVSTVYDLLSTCDHSYFPVVDTDDRDILYGSISRNVLTTLLQQRAYGRPANNSMPHNNDIVQNHVTLQPDSNYVPLVPYKILERVSTWKYTYHAIVSDFLIHFSYNALARLPLYCTPQGISCLHTNKQNKY